MDTRTDTLTYDISYSDNSHIFGRPVILNQEVYKRLSLIGKELYSIPSVENIFFSKVATLLDVWVVIPEHDLVVLDQIVEKEWKLLETLSPGENPPFLVDFHITYRCGRNLKDLISTGLCSLPKGI